MEDSSLTSVLNVGKGSPPSMGLWYTRGHVESLNVLSVKPVSPPVKS